SAGCRALPYRRAGRCCPAAPTPAGMDMLLDTKTYDLNSLAEAAQLWRRDLHQHPELLYDVPWTAAYIADRLREFGCDEVVTGIGGSGVVGVVKGALGAGPVRAFRAELDALPLTEATGLAYASKHPGKMHAC